MVRNDKTNVGFVDSGGGCRPLSDSTKSVRSPSPTDKTIVGFCRRLARGGGTRACASGRGRSEACQNERQSDGILGWGAVSLLPPCPIGETLLAYFVRGGLGGAGRAQIDENACVCGPGGCLEDCSHLGQAEDPMISGNFLEFSHLH